MKTFERKDVPMDWKKFGSIELKRLSEEIRTNNAVINELGNYITNCDIDEEIDTKQIDQNFVKLFKCSQVLIQHLLSEFNRFKSCENENKSQNNLIRENKKLRKLLEIQQKAMTYSRTFNGENVQCPYCPKVFFDPIFLKTHITRRHPNESLDSEGMLSLTDKIKDYQKILIGDNQSLDKMKEEMQVLTQKLAKTEADLMSEKDERIKLEERIEYVMKIRDKEIQQTLKEELEEFKFVQREQDIEKDIQTHSKRIAIDSNKSDEKNPKSLEMNKIEEIIALQAKEMIKLGNNVQKLVTHLTDNSEEDLMGKSKKKSLINTLNKIKTQVKTDFEEPKEYKNEEVIQITKTTQSKDELNKSIRKEVKDLTPEKKKPIVEKRRENYGITDAFNEVQRNLNEKMISLGLDINSNGITEEQYSDAMKNLNEERNLLIHQNRFDYNFSAIEQQIRKFVDKKVSERMGPKGQPKIEVSYAIPQVMESESQNQRDIQTETESPKSSKHSVEVIVHSSPINDQKVLDREDVSEVIEIKSEEKEMAIEKAVTEEKSSKPVLKSIISDKKGSNNNDIRAKQRRIRFSEQRIEHQISPNESSEETSDEYGTLESDSPHSSSNQSSVVPIPAQRTRKTDLTLDLKPKPKDEESEDSSDDINYEIDDQLMNEILHTNTYVSNEDSNEVQPFRTVENSSHQTKVQELAEMIEQQLNKRSAAHKKPPIGSVDVMTDRKSKENNSSIRRLDVDSDSD